MSPVDVGDVRSLHNTPAVWAGKARGAKTHGVHAVNNMQTEGQAAGSRKAVCGLVGRYLVDNRLTAGEGEFVKVPVAHRCHTCHMRWLEMAGES